MGGILLRFCFHIYLLRSMHMLFTSTEYFFPLQTYTTTHHKLISYIAAIGL